MNTGMHEKVEQIIQQLSAWVKQLGEAAQGLQDQADMDALEKRIRHEGRQMLAQTCQGLTQARLDQMHESQRTCPDCGSGRRHKGRRQRKILTSLGAVVMEDVYWVCPHCGHSGRALDQLAPQPVSATMHGLMCLLGTALSSFDKAQKAADQLLGVPVDAETIRQHCLAQGRELLTSEPLPTSVPSGGDLTGSCDGTMVNTREQGWRELKVFRFEHEQGVYLGAALERADRFALRLKRAATRVGASGAHRFWWVADAADWIDKAVALKLPQTHRIVDIWHAYQHVYAAGRVLYGEGTRQAKAWSERWRDRLRQQGARRLWPQLQKLKYQASQRQEAIAKLARFLKKQQNRMDYPDYEAKGWPISSGPMESGCKQLGLRLKGPGMRWRQRSVSPMSQMVALWCSNRWPQSLSAA